MRTITVANVKTFGLLMLAMSPCAMAAKSIPISGVEALYSALDNPAYDGATLVLAPDTYHLSALDPNGNPRSKEGRLELRKNMTLRGVKGDQAAVIISAYDLPAQSFLPDDGIAGPNAAIRMGLGENSLEWLTVLDARNAAANIDTGLQVLDSASTDVKLDHVRSSGSARGLNVLNYGAAASGQTIDVEILDSDFYDNDIGQAQGVRIGNFQGAVGSTVNVRMSGNHLWEQTLGCLIVNNNATSSVVNVKSSDNWFERNGAGLIVIGGFSQNNFRSDGNSIDLEARDDRYVDNTGSAGTDHGGLLVFGTENISANGGGSNNSVNAQVRDSGMLGNTYAGLVAIGARSSSAATAAHSQNDRVTIEVRRSGNKNHDKDLPPPIEIVVDNLPAGPNYGHSATVTHR